MFFEGFERHLPGNRIDGVVLLPRHNVQGGRFKGIVQAVRRGLQKGRTVAAQQQQRRPPVVGKARRVEGRVVVDRGEFARNRQRRIAPVTERSSICWWRC